MLVRVTLAAARTGHRQVVIGHLLKETGKRFAAMRADDFDLIAASYYLDITRLRIGHAYEMRPVAPRIRAHFHPLNLPPATSDARSLERHTARLQTIALAPFLW